MVAKAYVPDRGHLVWLTFDPQSGREQAGRQPAFVLSSAVYNHRAGLAVACPITSSIKGYPFEVVLPEGSSISGAILADQPKSLDWRDRSAEYAGRVPASVLTEVGAKLRALLVL